MLQNTEDGDDITKRPCSHIPRDPRRCGRSPAPPSPGTCLAGELVMTWRLLLLCLPLALSGCLADAMYGHLPSAVRMEPAVHALHGLNGPYDDFNAVAGPPPLVMDAFIAFSSNDATRGGRFSVDAGRITVSLCA